MMTVLRSSSAAVIPTPARKFWEFDVVKNMLTTHDNRETMQNYLSRKITFITIYLFTDLTIKTRWSEDISTIFAPKMLTGKGKK